MTHPSVMTVLNLLNSNRNFDEFDDVDLLKVLDEDSMFRSVVCIPDSFAQLRQDIVALIVNDFKSFGFFVEVGATDGMYLSNTLLLERNFYWAGIVVEPAKGWHERLHKNRRAIIDTRCVVPHSGGTVIFREVEVDPALSGIVEFSGDDTHGRARQRGSDYLVECVSLTDLLDENKAPSTIDYLSIDTEGSEFSILETFNFKKYCFKFISCEHNYSERRNDILKLLLSNGYVRILNEISQFDDFYVHHSILNEIAFRMPGWKEISHSNETECGPPTSKHEKTISLLQDTVYNLIADRDAYKNVVIDQMPTEISVRENKIRELQKTILEQSSAQGTGLRGGQESKLLKISLLTKIMGSLRRD